MSTDNFVKVYYESFEILGAEINVFECGKWPTNNDYYDDIDVDAFIRRTFATDNAQKDVFYEAHLSGSNKAFYVSKTPPTKEELLFQLRKSQQDGSTKVLIGIIVGFIMLYLILK